MTASALAGDLKLPLFAVLYQGLIGKLMGETATRLYLVFDAIAVQRVELSQVEVRSIDGPTAAHRAAY
jgi:hypothetical protein